MGVKQPCLDLEKDGYLDSWRRPPTKTGRPELLYRLTRRAYGLFPEANNPLTVEVLEAVQQAYGPAAPTKILFGIFAQRTEAYRPKIPAAALAGRAEALAQLRDVDGYMAEFEGGRDEWCRCGSVGTGTHHRTLFAHRGFIAALPDPRPAGKGNVRTLAQLRGAARGGILGGRLPLHVLSRLSRRQNGNGTALRSKSARRSSEQPTKLPLPKKYGKPDPAGQADCFMYRSNACENALPMISLIYVSSAVELFSAAELATLLETSRRNNAPTGITGMLLYKDGSFMQVIEGEEEEIHKLHSRISRDPRHAGLITLMEKTHQGKAILGLEDGIQKSFRSRRACLAWLQRVPQYPPVRETNLPPIPPARSGCCKPSRRRCERCSDRRPGNQAVPPILPRRATISASMSAWRS